MTEVVDYVGLVWHGHHEALIEWCYGYHERERYIQEVKAQEESLDDITLRLRLFKPVKGKLPEEVSKVFEGVNRARASLEAAAAAYHKARIDQDTAYVGMDEAAAAYNKTRADLDAARVFLDEASLDLGKAVSNARHITFRSHRAEIDALHSLECPNCPWNGKTIFPDRKAAV